MGRLVEFRGIPLVDRLPDVRHPLRAFALEKSRELLQQLGVSVHALQGRGHVEGGGLGLRPVRRGAGKVGSGHEASSTSKSSWGRSGLET